jgi:hypothetical protein
MSPQGGGAMGQQAVLTRLLAVVLLVWGLASLASHHDNSDLPRPSKFRTNQVFFVGREHGHVAYRRLSERDLDRLAAAEQASNASASAWQQAAAADAAAAPGSGGLGPARVLAASDARLPSDEEAAAPASRYATPCGCPAAAGAKVCDYSTGTTIINLCTARCLGITTVATGSCELNRQAGFASLSPAPVAGQQQQQQPGDDDGQEQEPADFSAASGSQPPPGGSNSSSSQQFQGSGATSSTTSGSGAAKAPAAGTCGCSSEYIPVCGASGKTFRNQASQLLCAPPF